MLEGLPQTPSSIDVKANMIQYHTYVTSYCHILNVLICCGIILIVMQLVLLIAHTPICIYIYIYTHRLIIGQDREVHAPAATSSPSEDGRRIA